jgi:hypothetical protein
MEDDVVIAIGERAMASIAGMRLYSRGSIVKPGRGWLAGLESDDV